MKSGTKNLFIGLGIAAGALLTVGALLGKPGKKIKQAISSKLPKRSTSSNSSQEDLYL